MTSSARPTEFTYNELLQRIQTSDFLAMRNAFTRREKGATVQEFVRVLSELCNVYFPSLDEKAKDDLFTDTFQVLDTKGYGYVDWSAFSASLIDSAYRAAPTKLDVILRYVFVGCPSLKSGVDEVIRKQLFVNEFECLFTFFANGGAKVARWAEPWDDVLGYTAHLPERTAILCADFSPVYNTITMAFADQTIRTYAISPRKAEDINNRSQRQADRTRAMSHLQAVQSQQDSHLDMSLPVPSLSPKMENELDECITAIKWNGNVMYTGSKSGLFSEWGYQVTALKERHRLNRGEDYKLIVKWEQRVHSDSITDICILPNRTIVTASLDGKLSVIEKFAFHLLVGHKKGVCSVSYSNEFKYILSAGFEYHAKVWIEGQKTVPPLGLEDPQNPHKSPLLGVEAVVGTPQAITCDSHGLVKVWDLRTLSCSHSFSAVPQFLRGAVSSEKFVAFSVIQQRRMLLMSSVRRSYLFEYEGQVGTREPELSHPREFGSACMCICSSCNCIVSGCKDEVKIWNLETGLLKSHLRNIVNGEVSCVATDTKGVRFFIGTMKGHVHSIQYMDGQHARNYPPPDEKCEATVLSFSESGRMVVAGMSNGSIVLWPDVHERTRLCVPIRQIPAPGGGRLSALLCSAYLHLIFVSNDHAGVRVLSTDRARGFVGVHKIPCTADCVHISEVQPYPAVMIADSTGHMNMWGVRPYKFRDCLLARWRNFDFVTIHGPAARKRESSLSMTLENQQLAEIDFVPCMTCATTYVDEEASVGVSITCDELGFLAVWDLMPIISKCDLMNCNKTWAQSTTTRVKSDLDEAGSPGCEDNRPIPELTSEVKCLIFWRAYRESVSSVAVIPNDGIRESGKSVFSMITLGLNNKIDIWTVCLLKSKGGSPAAIYFPCGSLQQGGPPPDYSLWATPGRVLEELERQGADLDGLYDSTVAAEMPNVTLSSALLALSPEASALETTVSLTESFAPEHRGDVDNEIPEHDPRPEASFRKRHSSRMMGKISIDIGGLHSFVSSFSGKFEDGWDTPGSRLESPSLLRRSFSRADSFVFEDMLNQSLESEKQQNLERLHSVDKKEKPLVRAGTTSKPSLYDFHAAAPHSSRALLQSPLVDRCAPTEHERGSTVSPARSATRSPSRSESRSPSPGRSPSRSGDLFATVMERDQRAVAEIAHTKELLEGEHLLEVYDELYGDADRVQIEAMSQTAGYRDNVIWKGSESVVFSNPGATRARAQQEAEDTLIQKKRAEEFSDRDITPDGKRIVRYDTSLYLRKAVQLRYSAASALAHPNSPAPADPDLHLRRKRRLPPTTPSLSKEPSIVVRRITRPIESAVVDRTNTLSMFNPHSQLLSAKVGKDSVASEMITAGTTILLPDEALSMHTTSHERPSSSRYARRSNDPPSPLLAELMEELLPKKPISAVRFENNAPCIDLSVQGSSMGKQTEVSQVVLESLAEQELPQSSNRDARRALLKPFRHAKTGVWLACAGGGRVQREKFLKQHPDLVAKFSETGRRQAFVSRLLKHEIRTRGVPLATDRPGSG